MSGSVARIESFYAAFAKKDARAMGACYGDDVRFSDPVFLGLVGREARGMWAMLCERAKDLDVKVRDVRGDATSGRAHWTARYTFQATGRFVVNEIDATFVFRDGLIVEHTDVFDFWRWSRQALGPTGLLLGWSPLVRNKVRHAARAGLDAYLRRAG